MQGVWAWLQIEVISHHTPEDTLKGITLLHYKAIADIHVYIYHEGRNDPEYSRQLESDPSILKRFSETKSRIEGQRCQVKGWGLGLPGVMGKYGLFAPENALSPPNFMLKQLPVKYVTILSGVFGRWLSHEVGDLVNTILCTYKMA